MISMKADILKLIDDINCNPILMRLAWHDSGTFDQRIPTFPERGGANGGIIHDPELNMGASFTFERIDTHLFIVVHCCETINKSFETRDTTSLRPHIQPRKNRSDS